MRLDAVALGFAHLADAAVLDACPVGNASSDNVALHVGDGRDLDRWNIVDAALFVAPEIDMVEQHALGEKPRERLVDMHQPHVAHHLGPEARVEQVQDRVLDAADVLVHRHPVIVARIDHRRRIRRGVAHVVPRRIDENVHGVGLALCRRAALWTGAVDEVGAIGERVAAAVRNAILGKDHGQVLLGHRHFAAARAMNDRDRRAPVTLSRNAPIAKPVGHALFAEPLRREIRGDRVDGLLIAHAVVLARVDQVAADLVFVPGLVRVGRECFAVDRDHLLDRQPVFFRELEIALVVGGHAHHRAVAVAHQHVIADPYLELFTGEWVHDEEAGRQAFLFHGREVRLDDRSALALLDEGGELRIGSCGVRGQRMLGGHRAEGHAHNGIGAGGEDVHPAVADRRAAKRTPSLLPIQLACMIFTRSGQPGILSRYASSSSAYSVMRR